MEERMGRPAARLACHGRRSLCPHAGEGRIGKLAATARDRGADGPACDLAACHGRPDAMQGREGGRGERRPGLFGWPVLEKTECGAGPANNSAGSGQQAGERVARVD
jgi:hypothetical protein